MSELTLLVLRIGFLLLLWFFIFSIVYALRSDLFGTPVRRMKQNEPGGSPAPSVRPAAPAPAPAPAPSPVPTPVAAAAPISRPNPAQAPAFDPITDAFPSANEAPQTAAATQLVITSGVAAGTSIPLDVAVFTIGRSSDSTLVIVDEYTSTRHASLAKTGNEWRLTDLDSTNGTKLDGVRVRGTVPVPPFTPVTIGTTTFELRP